MTKKENRIEVTQMRKATNIEDNHSLNLNSVENFRNYKKVAAYQNTAPDLHPGRIENRNGSR